MAVDHDKKAVVVAIRGTLSMKVSSFYPWGRGVQGMCGSVLLLFISFPI